MALAEATVRAAARGLAADAVAVEVLGELAVRGVPSLLLRGPAIERTLYAAGEVRPYGDVDLLVCPGDRDRVQAALRKLGFTPLVEEAELRGHRPLHATEWVRSDGVSVDVHITISGADAAPEVVWETLRSHAVALTVGGVEAKIPDVAGVALLVALHAAHHGVGFERCRADLRRALDRLPEQTWQGAARLAARIDATAAFVAGLSVEPPGRDMAARLGLPTATPADVRLRVSGAPPLALGLEWLSRTPGIRAKSGLVVRTAFPSPGAMRAWRPRARRGHRSLAFAYATHPLWLARHLPSSAIALSRARRTAE